VDHSDHFTAWERELTVQSARAMRRHGLRSFFIRLACIWGSTGLPTLFAVSPTLSWDSWVFTAVLEESSE
jgi:hypothetical protein